jgi:hypothetical protein
MMDMLLGSKIMYIINGEKREHVVKKERVKLMQNNDALAMP